MSDFELVRLAFHEVEASAGFAGWLDDQDVSIAFTNGHRLFLVGRRPDGSLSVVERHYGSCMAVTAVGADTVLLATGYQVWRLENALPAGQLTADGHDRLFVPQTAWTTGALTIHDLDVEATGRVVFVNGRFSCLATLSDRVNFDVLWRPPFITALVPEDRCGLTGVALVDGRPAFATSAGTSDTREGWRERQRDGGVVLAVPGGQVVAAGLALPHSPVVLDDGRLWLTNGGTGEVGFVDVRHGRFEAVAEMPGLARGLAAHGRYAAVGVSRPARGQTFEGVVLGERLARTGTTPRCGIFVVDLVTGRVEHSLLLDGVAPDVAGVAVLPGTRSPTAVAFQGSEVEELVTVPCPPP